MFTGSALCQSGESLQGQCVSQAGIFRHYASPSVDPSETSADEEKSDLDLLSAVALSEKAACTKVFFETHYHGIQFDMVTPRSLRRRKMESELWFSQGKSLYEKDLIRRSFYQSETDHLRDMRSMKTRRSREARGIDLAGYEPVRALGRGSFGTVLLVQEKPRPDSNHKLREVFAMKVIRKSEMLRNAQEGHLRAERDFLVKSAENAEWIVPLAATFQDNENLYLVMEFEMGGDFLEYMLNAKNGVVDEITTQ